MLVTFCKIILMSLFSLLSFASTVAHLTPCTYACFSTTVFVLFFACFTTELIEKHKNRVCKRNIITKSIYSNNI